jgi:hypothetical protein
MPAVSDPLVVIDMRLNPARAFMPLILLLLALPVRAEQELLLDQHPARLEMSVQVHPEVFSMGDTISIVISASNLESEATRLRFSTRCRFKFRITAPDGSRVNVDRHCGSRADSLVLMPGETARDTFRVAVVASPEAPDPTSMTPNPSIEAAEPSTDTTDSRSREIGHRDWAVHVPVGTIRDPNFVPPPRVDWPMRGGRLLPGVYRIEGGVRGQRSRWAAADVRVR